MREGGLRMLHGMKIWCWHDVLMLMLTLEINKLYRSDHKMLVY